MKKFTNLIQCFDRRWAAAFLPWLAVSLGTVSAQRFGVPETAFMPNLVGLVIGPFLIWTHAYWVPFFRLHARWFCVGILALMKATLYMTGDEGVHRWLNLGGFQLHVAMAFLPLLLVGIEMGLERRQRLAPMILVSTSVLLVLQPDAGEATAFASAGIGLLWLGARQVETKWRVLGTLVLMVACVAAWMQPDPLRPVAHVELIFHMMWQSGVLIGCAQIVVSMICLLGPFLWLIRYEPTARRWSWIFLLQLLTTLVVTEIGYFPVPVCGAGLSGVLSWYLMFSLALSSELENRVRVI